MDKKPEVYEQNAAISSGNREGTEGSSGHGRLTTSIRHGCMVFLADYSLMSGLITFLDTSGLHYGYAPLTVHSYLWHIAIAAIGVYSGLNLISCRVCSVSYTEQPRRLNRVNKVRQADNFRGLSCKGTQPGCTESYAGCSEPHSGCKMPDEDCTRYMLRLSDFVPASCIFLICCGIAEIINLSLDRYGTVNMFYINPHYYVNQMVFFELAHIIPNNIVILLYILCAMLAAFIVHLFWMSRSRKAMRNI